MPPLLHMLLTTILLLPPLLLLTLLTLPQTHATNPLNNPIILDIASLHIFTDTTKNVGERTRSSSPIRRQNAVLLAAYLFNTRNDTQFSTTSAEVSGIFSVSPIEKYLRSSSPDYLSYLPNCPVKVNVTMYDIGNTLNGAISSYRSSYDTSNNANEATASAIIADVYSSRTVTLSSYGISDDIPIISGSSTSSKLADTAEHPIFTRTVQSDVSIAQVVVDYITGFSYGSLAVFYVDDAYGRGFVEAVENEVSRHNLRTTTLPDGTTLKSDEAYTSNRIGEYRSLTLSAVEYEFNDGTRLVSSIRSKISELAAIETKVFVILVYDVDFTSVVNALHSNGVYGSDKLLIFLDGITIDNIGARSKGSKLYLNDGVIEVLSGSLRIAPLAGVRSADRDTQGVISEYEKHSEYWKTLNSHSAFVEYLEEHAFDYTAESNAAYFDAGERLNVFSGDGGNWFSENPSEGYDAYHFDAAMLIALGSCKQYSDNVATHGSSSPLARVIGGRALSSAINTVEFNGWTGAVSITSDGSRSPMSSMYGIYNIVSTPDTKVLTVNLGAVTHRDTGALDYACYDCQTMVYASGLSTPAEPFMPISDDGELGVLTIVLIVMVVVLLLCFIGCGVLVLGKSHKVMTVKLESEINELKHELSLSKTYGKDEKQKIEVEMGTFRKVFELHKEKNKNRAHEGGGNGKCDGDDHTGIFGNGNGNGMSDGNENRNSANNNSNYGNRDTNGDSTKGLRNNMTDSTLSVSDKNYNNNGESGNSSRGNYNNTSNTNNSNNNSGGNTGSFSIINENYTRSNPNGNNNNNNLNNKNNMNNTNKTQTLIDQNPPGDTLSNFLIPASAIFPKMQIGKGSFGEVYYAIYLNEKVAVKIMNTIDDENFQKFRNEILLMADLRHPNIVGMLGVCWENQLMALVLEFCPLGTTTSCLLNKEFENKWKIPMHHWLVGISQGLNYLHNYTFIDVSSPTGHIAKVNSIIHRDVKPDNCLVMQDLSVKVGDFGEARVIASDATMTMVGTPLFVAPEVFRGERYDTSADVYSFALTIVAFAVSGGNGGLKNFLLQSFEQQMVVSGHFSHGRVLHWMLTKGWRPRSVGSLIPTLPKTLAPLVEACWQEDPTKRPSFLEIRDYLLTETAAEMRGSKVYAANEGSGKSLPIVKEFWMGAESEEVNYGHGHDSHHHPDNDDNGPNDSELNSVLGLILKANAEVFTRGVRVEDDDSYMSQGSNMSSSNGGQNMFNSESENQEFSSGDKAKFNGEQRDRGGGDSKGSSSGGSAEYSRSNGKVVTTGGQDTAMTEGRSDLAEEREKVVYGNSRNNNGRNHNRSRQ